jgi:hypothetical protein
MHNSNYAISFLLNKFFFLFLLSSFPSYLLILIDIYTTTLTITDVKFALELLQLAEMYRLGQLKEEIIDYVFCEIKVIFSLSLSVFHIIISIIFRNFTVSVQSNTNPPTRPFSRSKRLITSLLKHPILLET